MRMGDVEMMKIFDFLMENKEIILSNNKLFSFNTLQTIRAIVRGKVPNHFELTKEQEQLMIEVFLKKHLVFDKDTPEILLQNEACIKSSLNEDINSLNFLNSIPSNLEDYIIRQAEEKNYILIKDSPDFLRMNSRIGLNSISLDIESANFISWQGMEESGQNDLIDKLIENNYILSINSHPFLKQNKRVALHSIQCDLNSANYIDSSIEDDYDILEYLIFCDDYVISQSQILRLPLKYFSSPKFMSRCLERLDLHNGNYREYLAQIYSDAIKKGPTIQSFQSIFDAAAEANWKEHKQNHRDDFENIFSKICAELRNLEDFDYFHYNLNFLYKMEDILKNEKYCILEEAMREYFEILHSEIEDKLNKIQKSKDTIAELSALYVSKSKENYKKEWLEEYYEWLRQYFTLNTNHPLFQRKVIQEKQRIEFQSLYNNCDHDTMEFIIGLIEKYREPFGEALIENLIDDFVKYNNSKLNEIIDRPSKYQTYQRYQEAIKLIRRLNIGNIKYESIEMTYYRDIISYDDIKKEYVYIGKGFSEQELKEILEYQQKEKIFEKIKRDIIEKRKKLEVDKEINDDLLSSLEGEVPFTDEYFVLDSSYLDDFYFYDLLEYASLNDEFEEENFKSESVYKNIYQLLVDNGMIWLLLFRHENYIDLDNINIHADIIGELVDCMDEITELSEQFNFDLTNFRELLLAKEISSCANSNSLAILGAEVIEKLAKYQEYTDEDTEEIVSMATELVCQMAKRGKSTVPYIQGTTMNYRYSMYDIFDEEILLAGIHTDACFRIDGNDNDFLHYCALDKNGFVIKITDLNSNFIGRASGFRNGNCVFINQLRTIYDRGGEGYQGKYTSEQNDIIATFKKACEDIVSISQNNKSERKKIDHVFVTQSYSLKCYGSNVRSDVEAKIGRNPMDHDSEDWEQFIENNNLKECYGCDSCFSTDYGSYALICMASIKTIIYPVDIKLKNVNALYERQRTPITVTEKPNDSIVKKINRIRAVQAYLYSENGDFKITEIPKQSTVFIGDNWYIIYQKGNIIDFCVLEEDESALLEFDATKKTLEEYSSNIDKAFDGQEIIHSIESNKSLGLVKIKK